jgi:hypothetical protein
VVEFNVGRATLVDLGADFFETGRTAWKRSGTRGAFFKRDADHISASLDASASVAAWEISEVHI